MTLSFKQFASLLFNLILLGCTTLVQGQTNSVTIGGSDVNTKAVLWLKPSGGQGLLLPSVPTTTRTDNSMGLTGAERGMIVYDSDENKLYLWDGANWNNVVNTQATPFAIGGDVTGNSLATVVSAIQGKGVSGATPGDKQILQWSSTSNSWEPTTLVTTTSDANITSVSPSKLLQAGASTGNVLEWNGSSWVPTTLSTTVTDANITSVSPSKLLQDGATAGSVLEWNGSAWVPASGGAPTGPAGGDLSGAFPNPSIAPGVIVNADVSGTAAISGAKVVPAFGSQNITTTGTITAGATTLSSDLNLTAGNIGIPNNARIGYLNTDFATYDGKAVGSYSLGWASDSWNSTGNTAWLSGYAGIKLFTSQVPRLSIDISGRVGIGTTTPLYSLDIAGDLNVASTGNGINVTTPTIGILSTTSSGLGAAVNGRSTNTTFGAGVVAEGNAVSGYGLIVGNVSGATFVADFSGSIQATSYQTSSDQKLKHSIKDLSGSSVELLQKINVKSYFYRSDEADYKMLNLPKDEQVGVIAQELEQVLPGLIKEAWQVRPQPTGETPDLNPSDEVLRSRMFSYKTVNYQGLVPYLVKAVQEQDDEIKTLKSKVLELEENNKMLKDLAAQVAELKKEQELQRSSSGLSASTNN